MFSRQSTDRSRGFTLLEVMVTLAIMGGIMATIYGVLFGTLSGKRRTELVAQGARVGPLLLDQIEHDIRKMFAYNLDPTKLFIGKKYSIGGRSADKIHLVAYTPSTLHVEEDRDKLVFSSINEIGYVLTPNPENEDFMILWRREDFGVDEEPLEDGYGVPLYRLILGMKIRYFDQRGKDAKEIDKWDPEENPGLPAAMEIMIDYEVEPRDRSSTFSAEELSHRQFHCKRFITFSENEVAAFAVRAAVPKQSASEEEQAGKGKNGKGDGADGSGGVGSKGNTGFGGGGGGGGGGGVFQGGGR